MKCNPDSQVISILGDLGSGFDCASRYEIELVISQGISADRIIFASPCKKPSDIEFAREVGVDRMTFDNEAELRKIKQLFPRSQLILRCFASDPSATYSLSSKFGAHPEESLKLLKLAKSLGLEVIGVSFHVGSGSKDPKIFEVAIKDSRRVVDAGLQLGHEMRLVDIGGGFSTETFDMAAVTIKNALNTHFRGMPMDFVAEPGRYFVANALTVACGIIARRDSRENPASPQGPMNHMLYLNDGIYGSFLTYLFEPCPQPKVLRASGEFYPRTCSSDLANYIIWGPTCDGIDCILRDAELPGDLTCGDWVYFSNMGGMSLQTEMETSPCVCVTIWLTCSIVSLFPSLYNMLDYQL